MHEEEISERKILLIVMIAVFLVVVLMNWLSADTPFLYDMLMQDGLTLEEMGVTLLFRSNVLMVLGFGSSIGLLFLNYHLGKKYRLTQSSTTVLMFTLIITILIGLFVAYGIRQLQLPQYPVLNSAIWEIPSQMTYPTIWCMLGMLAGNYVREIRQKERIS